MRNWIATFSFFVTISLQSALYDCFLFFNEIDLLKVHLEELYDHVDGFVIVEANQTFSGKPKEYLYPKLQNELAKYLDKIIYVPVATKIEGNNPWVRESFQRNQILRGLSHCYPKDLIIISDVDEIVKARYLPQIKEQFWRSPFPVMGFSCDFYRWFLNRKDPTFLVGPAITTYDYLVKCSPEQCRSQRELHVFQNGAWHFSNMGGAPLYLEKLASFSHFVECTPHAEEVAKNPMMIYDGVIQFSLVPIDETFPLYIQEHLDYYEKIGFLDTRTLNLQP